MQALRLAAFHQQPELVEVPDPTPGPGEVVIRVGGAGACHSDLHLIHDYEPGMAPWAFPFTLGHENAGWVEAVGAGVTTVAAGDSVAVYGPWGCGRCRTCMLGMENLCEHPERQSGAGGGLGRDGGMAPYMLVPDARFLVPLPEGLEPAVAAPLTDAGLTPYHAVKRSLPKLVPGSTAVVIGVGGLGHLGVQMLAAMSPARIVAVDQKPEALTMAAELGATDTVRAGADAAAEIAELTKGARAEVVLDFVGVEATLQLAAAAVRPLGDLTIVGLGGGVLPVVWGLTPNEASIATTYWGSRPELVEVLALAAAGQVHSRTTTYPLADALTAYDHLHRGTVDGRAVVVP